ncbi:MAG: hypothetical protein A2X49_07045 [Lentisphaerae bacterium GWF2_52_8]|nr:MAG: hypothetical protein A2X49_07045 [Lentisphaerae bacterium GWF2_52_8]
MKFHQFIPLCLLLWGFGAAADEVKSVEALWRGNPRPSVPEQLYKLWKDENKLWDRRFMPYNRKEADELYTDPVLQRETAASAMSTENPRTTAFIVLCNNGGIYCAIYAAEPELAKNADPAKLPNNSLEIFIGPGNDPRYPFHQFVIDLKTEKQVYHNNGNKITDHQFSTDKKEGKLKDYPWGPENRSYRRLEGNITYGVTNNREGYLVWFYIPWQIWYEHLPLDGGTDGKWGFNIIRWAPGGGQTWGGNVHQRSSFGKLTWPKFTQQQRDAIRSSLLNSAYENYKKLTAAFRIEIPDSERSFEDGTALAQQSSEAAAMPVMDQEFVKKFVRPMIEERDKLGKSIVNFKNLSEEEKTALYAQIDKLYEFNYDLENARRRFLEDKLFSTETIK